MLCVCSLKLQPSIRSLQRLPSVLTTVVVFCQRVIASGQIAVHSEDEFCSRIVDAIKHSCALLVVISIHQRSKCEFDHEYDRNFPSVTFPRLTRQFGKMTTSIFEQENVSHGKFTLYSCCQSCDAVIVLNGTLGKLYKSSCHGA